MYKTENEIKMALGLNAWRNLLLDKIVRFSRMMPEMDINLMMKLSGELPQLRDFARITLNELEKMEPLGDEQSAPDYTLMRKLISLDFMDSLPRELARDKQKCFDRIMNKLDPIETLNEFDANVIQVLCKRNQDSLRTFVITMLVYVGGCLQEPVIDELVL